MAASRLDDGHGPEVKPWIRGGAVGLTDERGVNSVGTWTKRILAIIVGAAAAFFVGSRIYDVREESQTNVGVKKAVGGRILTVDLAQARKDLVREELLLTGSLKPKEQVDITPKVTGRVEKIHFHVGDLVKAGTLVAEIEDDELQQQVNRATASLGVARASLSQREAERDNARAELERARTLFDDRLLSKQDYDALKTSSAVINAQVDLAQAQKEQAEAELRELRIRLEQSSIYSPLTAYVSRRYVDEGAVVTVSTPILQLVNIATMVTHGNVPERSIGKLRVGNEAIVMVDAIPEHPFNGRVSRISPVLDAATRSALIEIDIPNPRSELKAEMFARIRLDLGTQREATLIPREGLVYRGQQPGVYVVDGDRPVFRPIETGLTRAEDVEVLANLEPGTTIVGRGATMITEGDRIKAADQSENVGPAAQKEEGGPGVQRSAQSREPQLAGEPNRTGATQNTR
jgi:HlyD family secretion protein